ncbi:MAG: hypothetical protein FRX48_08131 [Lasallia pustulata]|uniref:Uncharacterized protein n=1 Tax=Lasallia pustulata TaxID=136370 RepID=A0A5M8PG98_9LECA|nr:MAG: hypothetical protein FRX48_08131 [Lasallia pustulata]
MPWTRLIETSIRARDGTYAIISNLLIDEYGLRTTPKKKLVILDGLYLLLYTHWVLDDSTFNDERQRVQVATGLLTAAFSVVDHVHCSTLESK